MASRGSHLADSPCRPRPVHPKYHRNPKKENFWKSNVGPSGGPSSAMGHSENLRGGLRTELFAGWHKIMWSIHPLPFGTVHTLTPLCRSRGSWSIEFPDNRATFSGLRPMLPEPFRHECTPSTNVQVQGHGCHMSYLKIRAGVLQIV